MPVNCDRAVVRLREWHCTQPTLSNSDDPFCAEADKAAGVGGAASRMNAAKLIKSEDIVDAVPTVVPSSGLTMCVASSGVALNVHAAVTVRSFWNISLVTPCSTL